MAAAIELRSDFSEDDLRLIQPGRQAGPAASGAGCDPGRRKPDGGARISGVGLRIVRDWMVRFNAEGPDGLIDRKAAILTLRSARPWRARWKLAPNPGATGWCAGG